jgi:hypothetical protein
MEKKTGGIMSNACNAVQCLEDVRMASKTTNHCTNTSNSRSEPLNSTAITSEKSKQPRKKTTYTSKIDGLLYLISNNSIRIATRGSTAVDISKNELTCLCGMPADERQTIIRGNFNERQRVPVYKLLRLIAEKRISVFDLHTEDTIETCHNPGFEYTTVDNLQYVITGDIVKARTSGSSPVKITRTQIEQIFNMSEPAFKSYIASNFGKSQRYTIRKMYTLAKNGLVSFWGLKVKEEPPKIKTVIERSKRGSQRKTNYVSVEGTNFSYRYDGNELLFRSKTTAPFRVEREVYADLISMHDSQVSAYVYRNYDKRFVWIARQLVRFVKSGKIAFFGIDAPKPKPWVEPEINKQIRAALKRTNPNNRQMNKQ